MGTDSKEKRNGFNGEKLISIVADLADKYTSKESTSVSYDTARQLMGAVMYCIREAVQAADEAMDSEEQQTGRLEGMLNAGTDYEIRAVYEKGSQLVLQKVMEAKALYERIITDFCSYHNQAYEDTLIKGMPAFFINYDIKFQPQNHLLTLDYPTIGGIGALTGIDAVFRYLQNIRLEQIFLVQFPDEYVTEVLSHYHEDYHELFLNISALVMRSCVGHLLAGKPALSFGLEEYEYQRIDERLSKLRRSGREAISQAILNLIMSICKENQALAAYLAMDVRDFTWELENAAKNHCLHKIFPF